MKSPLAANQSYYRAVSVKAWDRHRDVASPAQARPLVSSLLTPGSTWLDVGCGRGDLARLAQELQVSYQGIDLVVSEPRAELLEGNFLELEFSERFNLISFYSSLHHFDDWKAAVNKAMQLLKPGGYLLIDQEPTRVWAWIYRQRLKLEPKKYATLLELEKHWLQKPSILAEELPPGITTYHCDYLPLVQHLQLRTESSCGKFYSAHYRKLIRKDL